jgi:hypothetical protein
VFDTVRACWIYLYKTQFQFDISLQLGDSSTCCHHDILYCPKVDMYITVKLRTRSSWNWSTDVADERERLLRSRDVPSSNVDRKNECLESSNSIFIHFLSRHRPIWKGQYYLPYSLYNLLLTSAPVRFIYYYVYYCYCHYYYYCYFICVTNGQYINLSFQRFPGLVPTVITGVCKRILVCRLSSTMITDHMKSGTELASEKWSVPNTHNTMDGGQSNTSTMNQTWQ